MIIDYVYIIITYNFYDNWLVYIIITCNFYDNWLVYIIITCNFYDNWLCVYNYYLQLLW